MLRTITNLFPLWAVLFSLAAYFSPATFTMLKPAIIPLLTVIMLTMGLTLKGSDFLNVLRNKKAVGIGLVLQFSVMPLAALLVSRLLELDTELTIGMVLVGSVAGGTASNVMCYLAKGDVALSISMTAMSTLLGVVMTPLLVQLLAGQSVDVPVLGMLFSLLKIVVIPVILGIVLNSVMHPVTRKLEPVLPLVSMLAIVTIIAIVVALNADQLAKIGPIVALAVIMHNSTGLVSGYWACRWLGMDEKTCRTIAFEVGLQNSGLATALAMKFFTPASAVAGTIFSIWHNLSGSCLAGIWARKSIATSSRTAETL
ncbi:bile acid:sodium symporter family protein [Vibrio mangrovi]|uniref:Bile acid:sodium symporter family protein n=1 Tax=Vibrio mangrovi TaxID=474394 RepID=A0A1Y6IQS0_9VIBR|nr:bile acid:sodium symporter family protein [Vibrio mangrovi]MDW6003213.1 bile acid:sodium symporter family protein [Vibrio mangrovi]SMR99999.1 Sodium Bile acid symporter family protein [Vibrio mangrovi]